MAADGELWIRPVFHMGYHVGFADNQSALEYSHLYCRYFEEVCEPDRLGRGLHVVSRQGSKECGAKGAFATLDLGWSAKPHEYLLTVALQKHAVERSTLDRIMALSYGHGSIPLHQATTLRTAGALVTFALKRLSTNFEVDAIRAAIGDFRSSSDLEARRTEVVAALKEHWEGKVGLSATNKVIEKGTEPSFVYSSVRSLYSPLVREALDELL